jgi:high-affinity iron transporter
MARTEHEMMSYRALLQSGASPESVEQQAATVRALLGEARDKLHGTRLSPATTFVSALVILLREGAEAILVVAAILAFLLRAGRPEARRWVHAGWIGALALGGITWAVSSYLVEISGAGREITEGATALIAAAMLLYVGYWLHSKSHSATWQKFIADKVGGALSTGTVGTLALVSFLAVYREAFETVLFYQALAAQTGPDGHGALLGGLALAAVLLVALAWAVLRASVKLPLGLFFSASGIVLLLLAVVFSGQGIAALQEAGKIGADGVSFISVPLLGIYPTLQTLAAQIVAIALGAAGLWWAGRTARAAAR